MKTLLLLSVLAAFFAWSCSNSQDSMSHNYTIDKALTIDHSGAGSGPASDKLNMWESAASFMQNRPSMKSLAIRSISCTITDIQGPQPQTLTGTLSIGDMKGGAPKPVASLNKVSMMNMMSGMHNMDMHSDGSDMMMDMMMQQDSMMMYFDCQDQDSMHFTMRFKIDMQAECDCEGM